MRYLLLVFGLCCCAALGQDNGTGLTAADVDAAIRAASASVASTALVIAISDRQGNVLGVFQKPSAPMTVAGNFGWPIGTADAAVALARTAAFFSNNQAPLSSRTVRFVSGIHFPPGIAFAANGPLYGIESTNRGCSWNVTFNAGQELPAARSVDGSQLGPGALTGKKDFGDSDPNAVNPGGVPLFRNGVLVGGIGVAGDAGAVTEFAAFSGARGAGLGASPAAPGVILINGIALPFVKQLSRPEGVSPGAADEGSYLVGPKDSPGPAPQGYLVGPSDGPIGGLTSAEVQNIVAAAIEQANQTRAALRLPIGSRAQFVISVADLDGSILALYRMPDAPIFSVDVSIAKARNVIYFSSQDRDLSDLAGVPAGTAVTNRTIGFGAQPLFAPGIINTSPGPFFDLFQFDALNPCTQGRQPANPNQNGVVFFPGSAPLYRDGKLSGGLGVSGDGVDQDDFVTSAAAALFPAPDAVRADQVTVRGARLPYWKFPRNPTF